MATKEQVAEIAKRIRFQDRLCKKYNSSMMTRVSDRIAALDSVGGYTDPCRASAYPAAWGVDAGRASTEFVLALNEMSSVKFAQIACNIAEAKLCVRDAWEAWKTAAT